MKEGDLIRNWKGLGMEKEVSREKLTITFPIATKIIARTYGISLVVIR
ncbi:MAG: hypothetical protein V3V41_02965 [Candidatus Heimdallarchaeota archaeon]